MNSGGVCSDSTACPDSDVPRSRRSLARMISSSVQSRSVHGFLSSTARALLSVMLFLRKFFNTSQSSTKDALLREPPIRYWTDSDIPCPASQYGSRSIPFRVNPNCRYMLIRYSFVPSFPWTCRSLNFRADASIASLSGSLGCPCRNKNLPADPENWRCTSDQTRPSLASRRADSEASRRNIHPKASAYVRFRLFMLRAISLEAMPSNHLLTRQLVSLLAHCLSH